MKTFEELFQRPDDSELLPAMALLQSGGSSRDFILAGLVDGRELVAWQRGERRPTYRLVFWDPRTIIRYNRESGSLRGLATNGPTSGGYGVMMSTQGPGALGVPLEVAAVPEDAWKAIEAWAGVEAE